MTYFLHFGATRLILLMILQAGLGLRLLWDCWTNCGPADQP